MLTAISLKNFKSWQELGEVRLAPITGLFGTNSSGKTSILQWLLMLKQTAESSDRQQVLHFGDQRTLVELGTFPEVVHGHERPGCTSWKLSWRLPSRLEISDPEGQEGQILFQGDAVTFSCTVKEAADGRLAVQTMAYEFSDHFFGLRAKEGGRGYELEVHGPGEFRFKMPPGRHWPLPHPVKCYGFPDQVNSYYHNAGFLADFQLAFEQMLARIFYLGPLREYPQRQYVWGGAQPADMGPRGEKVIDAILSSRERGETIPRGRRRNRLSVEQYAAYWLKKLRLIEEFEARPEAEGSNLYRAWVRRSGESSPVLITDVGFGISQILPVIVLCYYVPEGATVILEQPEIHLHPSVQAGLADILIDAVKVRKLQVIVESHSEHLLLRLQRRVAEREISPQDVALFFCEFDGSRSTLKTLDLDLFGNITNWPRDFFGDEVGEMAAMTRAAMARRQEVGG